MLTRQKIAKIQRPVAFDAAKVLRGGYVVADPPGAKVTLVATGSELATAQGAAALLAAKGIAARLVSVPCLACFEAQPEAVRREVIPAGQRVAVIEAGRALEWWRSPARTAWSSASTGSAPALRRSRWPRPTGSLPRRWRRGCRPGLPVDGESGTLLGC